MKATRPKRAHYTTTRLDLIRKISQQMGIEPGYVSDVLEKLLIAIQEEVKSGKSVELRGFGRFFVREQRGKKGRVIHGKDAGKVVDIPDRMMPRFSYAESFKRRVIRDCGGHSLSEKAF